MAEKSTNYTEAQEQALRVGYSPSASEEEREAQIEILAESLGKNVKSIRAKLVHLGLYVPKAKAPAGKAAETKAAIVEQIAQLCGVNSETVESLEKATKKALTVLRQSLTKTEA